MSDSILQTPATAEPPRRKPKRKLSAMLVLMNSRCSAALVRAQKRVAFEAAGQIACSQCGDNPVEVSDFNERAAYCSEQCWSRFCRIEADRDRVARR